MMGSTHALTGTTAWAALAAAAPAAGSRPHWPAIAAGTLACAGAALLPDADHDEATVAKTLGPIGQRAAGWIGEHTGGHRGATHSLLFAACCSCATWIGVGLGRGWFAVPLLALLYAFALRALRVALEATLTLAVLAAVAAWSMLGGDYGWLPLAVVAGVLTHLAGDCLTPQGCPLFWPCPAYCAVPMIARTGGWLELRVITPVSSLCTLALLVLAR